jgi:hypothetical protein
MFSPQHWPSEVSISYCDGDAKAADLMESALIKSYVEAQGLAWGLASPETTEGRLLPIGSPPPPAEGA